MKSEILQGIDTACNGYIIAKNKEEKDHYKKRIVNLQKASRRKK